MDVMYVACPSCKALYQIELLHLRAAGGQLRCGSCQTTFNATAAVFETPQQAIEYVARHPVEEGVVREIDDLVNRALGQVPVGDQGSEAAAQPGKDAEGMEALEEQSDDKISAATQPVEALQEAEMTAQSSPSYVAQAVSEVGDERIADTLAVDEGSVWSPVHQLAGTDIDFYACPIASEFAVRVPDARREPLELTAALLYGDEIHEEASSIPWGTIALSLALALLLLGQLAWVERYQLVRFPQLRAGLEFFCQPLQCDLPLRHDTSRLEMVERDVRDHPHVNGALLINATFINRAEFWQTYPVFEVSFSDVSGTPVAVRRFQPSEYLIGQQDISTGMAPGERAQLMLEVRDPGDRAVSFQFDFL